LTKQKKAHPEKAHSHKPHPRKRKKKTPAGKYAFGIVVFIVLVAVVAGLIWLSSKAGESRLARQSDIAATVNGEEITTAQLDDQYSKVPDTYRPFITKEILLNQTINEVVMLQEAEKQGIITTEDDVEQEIQSALLQSGITEEELDTRLDEQNITKEYLKDLYRKQLTINNLLEEVVFVNIEVDETDVEELYNSSIIKELKTSSLEGIKDDFAALAEEKSTDPSAATNKGDLGEFGRGQMVPEFEKAAFALEEYAFTAVPIKSQFGYHIILRLPKEQTLSEQYSSIEEFLLNQKKSQAVPLYVEQLRSKADIEILYEEPAVEAVN
jgi:foldase protein PrsA